GTVRWRGPPAGDPPDDADRAFRGGANGYARPQDTQCVDRGRLATPSRPGPGPTGDDAGRRGRGRRGVVVSPGRAGGPWRNPPDRAGGRLGNRTDPPRT